MPPLTRLLYASVLWLFILVVYIVHYQTIWIQGTLHSWVLLAGAAATLPYVVARYARDGFRIPRDHFLIYLLGAVLAVGTLLNLRAVDPLNVQAYVLSLVSYLFVREAMPAISLRGFYRFVTLFVIANSVLMILQFLTGEYFPARYIANGNPPLLLPSGFADGPTKNGVIHASSVALVLGRIIFMRAGFLSMAGLAVAVGLPALLLTLSRAGVAGFVFGAAATFVLARRSIGKSGQTAPRWRRLRLVTAFTAILMTLTVGTQYLRAAAEDDVGKAGYIARVFVYKFVTGGGTEVLDDSLTHRIATISAALFMMSSNPLNVIVGFGLGAFDETFAEHGHLFADTLSADLSGLNLHNSYLEVLFEGGVIAFVLLLVLMRHVVRKALARPDAATIAPLVAALLVTATFMLFHDVIRGRVFWMPMGMVAALAYAPPRPPE